MSFHLIQLYMILNLFFRRFLSVKLFYEEKLLSTLFIVCECDHITIQYHVLSKLSTLARVFRPR